MNVHDDVTTDATASAPRSPQQRRLAGLIASGDARSFRTVCQVAVPDGLDEPGLSAAGGPIVRELFTAIGVPAGEPFDLTLADGVLTLDLPAACADEPTALAVVREILNGGNDSGAAGVPHDAAAQWWDELTRAPSAGPVREFWRARAAGWPAPFPAILGGPDTTGAAATTGTVTAAVDRKLLNALCEPAGAPAWLLATWQVLLRRRTGLDDVVIGVATDLRRHDELRGCRGPLTAHLPTRAPAPLTEPLTEHARVAAGELAEGTDRAEWFGWEQVLADRSASTRPLNFGFSYTVLPEPWTTAAGQARVLRLTARGDAFPLWLRCQEEPDALTLRLEYDPGLVSAELAADLVAELPALLAAGHAEPERPAEALPLGTPENLARLLHWGTGPVTELPEDDLPALVRATAHDHPHATALRDDAGSVTYRQLVTRMDGLAATLREHGVGPEDRVAVSLPPGAGLLVALLGVLASGGAYLYLDPALPPQRSAMLATDAAARLVVTASGGDSPVPGLPVLPVDAPTTAPAGLAPVPLDALAYVIHTSGSTGAPKGVQVTHRGLVNYLTGVAGDWPAGCDSLVSTSPAFDLALPALYLPLLSGGTVTFGSAGVTDPAVLADELATRPYALVRATPAQLRTVQAELAARRESGGTRPAIATRCMALGGEPLPASLASDWARTAPETRLLNYYGPTETVGARTHGPVDPGTAGPTGTVPLGAPVTNTMLQVLDELRPCPLGVTGELYIGGTGLARGYTGDPAATAERFVPDPFGQPGARRYRTGDLVRWLPGQRLEFVARADDQVKIRGHRIEPAEVATALAGHPGVRDVVVTGRQGPDGSTGLVAYAVATGEPVPVDELRRHAGERLPDYMLPTSVLWLDALPLGPNGKVNRSALPEPGGERPEQTVAYRAPRTETERVLAKVWAETLGLERVGVLDNFYAIGGDSILSIMVAAKAAKRGLTVSLRHFFEHQTIAAMAPHVAPAEPATAARPAGRRLTPVQHWFFEQGLPHPGHWNQGWLLTVDGEPDVPALAAAVDAVTAQHPALGSAFEPDPSAPGGWRPVRGPATPAPVFRALAVEPGNWAARLTSALAGLQEVDISTGPLLRVALLDGGPGLRRLVLIGHHLVVDIVSWQIIFEDLDSAYRQAHAGSAITLPAASTPPDEWAGMLAAHAGQAEQDLDYWLDQCPAGLPALPVDHQAGTPLQRDQRWLEVVLDPPRTECLLRRMPANVRVDQVLTAAVALAVAGWSGQPYLHLTVEGQGRTQDLVPGAKLYRSVGWFTALAPLLIRIPDADPLDALREVHDQLVAMPRDGLSYGVLRYLHPEHGARFAGRPQPQLSVNYIGVTGGTNPSSPRPSGLMLRPAPEPLPALIHPASTRSRLWTLNGVVAGGELHVNIGYAGKHYRPATAQRLVDGVAEHLTALIDAWIAAGGLPTGPGVAGQRLPDSDREVTKAVAQAMARAPRRPVPTTEASTT